VLALDPTDRTGCHATRLPDGSLVERLAVGRAHGAWHLLWVRSEVPRAEVRADLADHGSLAMPHERLVRLRSADGPLVRLPGSGSLGGGIAQFGVEVPEEVCHLEIGYLHDDEVVATEELALRDAD
jgi:hypothetical protein